MDPILALIIVYSAASLLHHAHNAEFLAIYPGLPGWLSPAHIYAAWIVATLLATVGRVGIRQPFTLCPRAIRSAHHRNASHDRS